MGSISKQARDLIDAAVAESRITVCPPFQMTQVFDANHRDTKDRNWRVHLRNQKFKRAAKREGKGQDAR